MTDLRILGRYGRVILIATLLAAGAFASADAGPRQGAELWLNRADAMPVAPAQPPMVFYVANGPVGSCGPGCNEWIAAEGNIDRNAAQRLLLLLLLLRDKKLPIFFHSRGGVLREALAMGQLLREHKLRAGVARTLPEVCTDSGSDRKGVCQAAKRSEESLKARLRSDGAYCFSACVYAFIGAPVREVSLAARLGVHAAKVYLKRPPDNPDEARVAMARAANNAKYLILNYLRGLGYSKDLFEIANRVPHQSVHLLTREEIERLNIAKNPPHYRRAHENIWRLRVYEDAPAATTIAVAAKTAQRLQSHKATLRVMCAGPGQAKVHLRRERHRDDRAITLPIKVRVGGHEFALPPRGRRPPINSNGVRIDDRSVFVPAAFFEGPGESVKLIDAPHADQAGGGPGSEFEITTDGLAAAFAALKQQCNDFPPYGVGFGTAELRQ